MGRREATGPSLRTLPIVACLLLVVSCGGNDSPTGPSCRNVAGTYNLSFSNSCGSTAHGVAVVAQSACAISAAVPGVGQLQGAVDGNTVTFTLTPTECAAGPTTGSGMVGAGGSISGTFRGTSSGGSGCCPAGTVTGSFTLTP
jgi:hypothetical protein